MVAAASLLDVFAPVVALIGLGYGVYRVGLIPGAMVKPLSDLAFVVFAPALLFRAIATTPFENLNLDAPLAYFSVALSIFFLMILVSLKGGISPQQAAVNGLASTFSNNAMMGIPVVSLAYGNAGLSVLLTIIAFHALLILTSATLILELGRSTAQQRLGALLQAIKNSVIHPVVLPIICGVIWSLAHWPIPKAADSALGALAAAAPPLCLILLGASIAQLGFGAKAKTALRYCLSKNIVQPLATYCFGRWVLGIEGLALTVATLAAAMPIGNNVFLFAQRYQVSQAEVGSGIVLSTLISAPVTLLILWQIG
jgi:malonate transporter and related proteins